MPRSDDAGPSGASDGPSSHRLDEPLRKIRVHKVRPRSASMTQEDRERMNLEMERKITELVPGIADLSLSDGALASTRRAAADVRRQQQAREEQHKAEAMELGGLFDMSQPHWVDTKKPDGEWTQQLRPRVRKIQLSPYQYEMINYQRMLLRKNVWYYRDRMSVPRGPCPLHVLKEAWVQGVVDEHTLVWGHGLYDWLPAKNVKLLLPMIMTPEVRFGTWLKRTFSLKPALNRIREARKDVRDPATFSKQVEAMR